MGILKKTIYLTLVIVIAGCSFKRDFDYMRDKITEIDERLVRVEQQTSEIDSTMNSLYQYTRENSALSMQLIQSLERKIEALREALQFSKTELSSIIMRIESISDTTGISSQDAFNSAYLDFTKGDYDLAEMGFTAFSERYPYSMKIVDATFYLAESQFYQEKYNEALSNYSKLRLNYPMNEYQATILYRSGIAKHELGDPSGGNDFFRQVIEAYPESPEAQRAKEKLNIK